MNNFFCRCLRCKANAGPYNPECPECMVDLKVVRPDWAEDIERRQQGKPVKEMTTMPYPMAELQPTVRRCETRSMSTGAGKILQEFIDRKETHGAYANQ